MATRASVRPGMMPRADLPPRIFSDVPGTWAHDTMSRRVRDEILSRIYEENPSLPPSCIRQLDELKAELQQPGVSKLRHIRESDGGPDKDVWRELLGEWVDKGATWLSAPWLITEFYFYRRVLEAVDWYQTQIDPFEQQKKAGLADSMPSIEALAQKSLDESDPDQSMGLHLHVFASLWGNKMDLSLWPSSADSQQNHARHVDQAMSEGSAMLLADDFAVMWDSIRGQLPLARVDMVADNAGFELVSDMCLADCLVRCGIAKKVVFQLKEQPVFVSDAMPKDAEQTIDYMASLTDADKYPSCVKIAQRLRSYVDENKWQFNCDGFWNQPYAFWEMPPGLRQTLANESSMMIVKGDCNYRRLLGDRYWPLSTPFSDVVTYSPTRMLALRALKAELGCGMAADKTQKAAESDPKWMVNGRWGVVQFYDPFVSG